MLYSAWSCLSPASSRWSSRSVSLIGGTVQASAMQEEPDERQPQFARIWDGPVVNQDLGRVRPPHQLEQVLEPRRVRRQEARAVAVRGARPHLPELGRRPRQLQRAIELRDVEPGKGERDRERPRRRPEQRLLQIRIEGDQLFLGRLLGQIRVWPEAFERSVLWSIGGHS